MQGRREQTSASYSSPVNFRPSHTSQFVADCGAAATGYIRVDYEGATRLKVAIAAAATNVTVALAWMPFSVCMAGTLAPEIGSVSCRKHSKHTQRLNEFD
nr:hypothetical protein Iba_chr06cCG0850 [Ipomoea batatas]